LRGVGTHDLVDRHQAGDGVVEDLLLHCAHGREQRQRDPTEERHQDQKRPEAAYDLEPE
jgi:hypothetical protein